jgi:hypothetical protein
MLSLLAVGFGLDVRAVLAVTQVVYNVSSWAKNRVEEVDPESPI